MIRFIRTVPEVNYTISVRDDLYNIPKSVTNLFVAPHCCNQTAVTELDMSELGLLKSIVIGDGSMKNVRSIRENPLLKLVDIEVGVDSLSMFTSV